MVKENKGRLDSPLLEKIYSISKDESQFEKAKRFFEGRIWDYEYSGSNYYFFDGDIREMFKEAKGFRLFDVENFEELKNRTKYESVYKGIAFFFYLTDGKDKSIKDAFYSVDEIRDEFPMSLVAYEVDNWKKSAYATIIITY